MSSRVFDDLSLGLPKNFMRPCLLLLLCEQPAHGYDLLERLQELGFGSVDPGGLYRALRAMEQERLVASRWEASDVGPARRTYEPTEDGRDWLHAWAGSLRETRRVIDGFLDRYEALDSAADRASRR